MGDLYPFEQTVAEQKLKASSLGGGLEEALIIEDRHWWTRL